MLQGSQAYWNLAQTEVACWPEASEWKYSFPTNLGSFGSGSDVPPTVVHRYKCAFYWREKRHPSFHFQACSRSYINTCLYSFYRLWKQREASTIEPLSPNNEPCSRLEQWISHHQSRASVKMAAPTYTYVQVQIMEDSHVALVKYNRPQSGNSLLPKMLSEMVSAMNWVNNQPEIRIII